MSPAKLLVAAIVMSALLLSGCGKKKAESAPGKAAPQASTTQGSANKDVFDEFYDEGGSKQTTGKKAAKDDKTFSTKPKAVAAEPSGSYQFSESGRYTVQVSTVTSRALAEKHVEKIKARGYPAYASEVVNPTPALSGAYYRVRVGGLATVSSARQFGEELQASAGYEFWVDNKSNDNVGMEGYGMGSGASSSSYSTPASSSSSSSSYGSESSTSSSSYGSERSSSPTTSTGSSTPAGSSTESSYSSTPATTESSPGTTPAVAEPAPAPVEPAPAPAPEPATSTTPSSTTTATGTGSSGAKSTGTTGGTDEGWGDSGW